MTGHSSRPAAASLLERPKKDVDGRDERGHDSGEPIRAYRNLPRIHPLHIEVPDAVSQPCATDRDGQEGEGALLYAKGLPIAN